LLVTDSTTDSPAASSIILDQTGPKKVYSGDILFSPGIKAVSDGIILLVLKKGERLRLTGTIEEGSVFEQNHSKYSVSCGTTYTKKNDSLFLFKVETTGCISAKNALRESIRLIKDDILLYKKSVD
jgi:DNA-directed RNA polymerase alpha subunit